MSHPLDYASAAERRPRRRWPVRLIIAVVVLSIVVVGLLQITISVTDTRIDAVTGSMMRQTVWFGRFTRGPVTDVSALELRLRKMGARWTPDWRHLDTSPRNILGWPTARACDSAPPILQVRGVMEFIVASLTDDELLQFVHTMESGSEAEQRAAVDAAVEKAIRAPATTEPAR